MALLTNHTAAPTRATHQSWKEIDAPMPIRRLDIRIYEIDGEAVLFDTRTRKLLHLNATALAVFLHCDGLMSIRHVAQSLTDCSSVGLDTALSHVEQLIGLFTAANLLTFEDSA